MKTAVVVLAILVYFPHRPENCGKSSLEIVEKVNVYQPHVVNEKTVI